MGSVWVGTLLAFVALFALGYAKGRVVAVPALRSGMEILVIGGAATAAGIAVGIAFGHHP